ncbi:trypsin-like serine peptidase [Kineococcus sp. SYSU DK006]|uniref:trypsin-like serine peptidase n=1 Tax=Kineococcus sp. SYSU DK006 TaxID=3383127 RepID=UPI003D7CC59A
MSATARRAPRRASRRSAAGAVGAFALTSATALAVVAAPGSAAVPVQTGERGVALLSSVDEAAQQAALDYWTPERMAAARPAGQSVEGGPAAAGAAADGSADGAAPAAADGSAGAPQAGGRSTLAVGDAPRVGRDPRSTASVVDGGAVSRSTTWTAGGPVTAKVGRLYFTQAGVPYECSASSVDSPNESVVITAGHCVTERGVSSTNVVFVPGLNGTAEPFGRWSATRLFTTRQWMEGDQKTAAALNHDVGFAVVAKRGQTTLADAVGTFGLAFDSPLDRVTVFGYPGRGTGSDGSTLKYCAGWRFTDATSNPDATTDQATLCDMAGGSSGGPWLSGFDPANGTGTVTSVVSFSYNDAPEVLYGPRLGAVERAVYAEASAVAVG